VLSAYSGLNCVTAHRASRVYVRHMSFSGVYRLPVTLIFHPLNWKLSHQLPLPRRTFTQMLAFLRLLFTNQQLVWNASQTESTDRQARSILRTTDTAELEGKTKDTRTLEPVLQRVVQHGKHVVLGALVRYRMLAVPLTACELEEIATRINSLIQRLQNARSLENKHKT